MRHYMSSALLATILLIAGAASPTSGEKELIIKLQGEVIVLQRQVRDLQESFDKWQGQSTASLQKISETTTDAAREISGIEEAIKRAQSSQNSSLAGTNAQLQKISNQLSQQDQSSSSLRQEIDSLRKALQDHQNRLESHGRSDASADRTTLTNNPKDLFATAYQQFKSRNYESAIKLFRDFLDSHGQGEESDDATFWIAESLSSLARYDEALREYNLILSEYPRGDKITAALLKKGITLLHLERRSEGINTLRALLNQFPNSQEASAAKDELSRLGEKYSSSASGSVSGAAPQNRERPR